MKKLDKRLWGLIKSTKGQFFAISVVVAIGLMIFVSMGSAESNLQSALKDYYQLTNFSDLYVQVVKIPEKDISKIQSKYHFSDIEGRIVSEVPMITEDENERVTVRVTSVSDEDRVNRLYYIEGSPIQDKNHDVILVQQFAEARDIHIGDPIRLQINGRQYKMIVKGIAASAEYIYLIESAQNMLPNESKFGVAYVSKEFAQRSFGLSGSANEVIIKLNSNQDPENMKDVLKDDFENFGLKRIITQENQLSNRMMSEELAQLKNISGSIPILFLSIAGIVLVMMVSRMVKKDRISIGVMKALGYSASQIILHYTKYALSAGALGVFLGSLLGTVVAGAMTEMYIEFFNLPLLKINFYPQYVFWSIAFAGVFCGVSGIWGAKEILKIMPAESMRPEAPKAGKRIFLENFKFFWNHLSFSWKMVIKNAFRNKKRMVFVLFGVSLTCSMMVATISLVSSTLSLFDKHFTEFQKMDYNINFSTPLNEDVVKEIPHLVETQRVEPKIEFPFEVSNGLKKEIVNVIGINRDTEFYSFKDMDEKITRVSEEGILITENLAKALKVNKGAHIKIHSFIPGREDIYLRVENVIKQGLGMNAYMALDSMGNELMESQLVTGAYVDSKDPDIVKKLINADHIATIQSSQDMLNIFQEFMGLTIMSIGFIVVMAGILGFSIVYNATVISIGEREMEFSSMRVLGFSKNEIFSMILRESIVITIFGILIGIPVGRLMGSAMGNMYSNEIYTMEIIADTRSYLLACFFTILFITLSQLATYRKIRKLNFLQALKNRVS